jgi:glutamine synthetase
MDLKDAKSLLEEHDVDNVRMIIVDINGSPVGKRLPVDKFLSTCEHGMSFCSGIYNLLGDSDIIPELPLIGGFSTGFPDVVAWPDLNTLRIVSWEDRTALIICDMLNQDGCEIPYDARTVLKKQVAELKQHPFSILAGMEYEFYVFKETPETLVEKNWSNLNTFFEGPGVYSQVRSFKAGYFMRDIWQLLSQSGVPVDSMQVELGAGMFEFPIKESDPLSAADRAVIGKMAIKEICHHHNLLASFMAKIHPDLEGLSGAVHHSLIDKDGNNLFHDPNRPHNLSKKFDQWAEGILKNLQDMTLILLPNFNSYKRPLPGCFVGNSTTWSVESRGTTLRIINFDSKATRIENRLPGSDGNPYLVLAAHIAAGLYGFEHKLALRPPFVGADPAFDTLGRDDVKYIPTSLGLAIERFKSSDRMKEFFGEEFCEVFAAHRQFDLDKARSHVADWEREKLLVNA